MSKPNRLLTTVDGEKIWDSRSVVVVALVIKISDDNKVYTLLEKRGCAVTQTNKWCMPCGYLDYDENLNDAVIREVREETGYCVDPSKITFVDIESEPIGKKQNVVIRHIVIMDENSKQIDDFQLDINEVTELKWLEIGRMRDDNIFEFDIRKLNNIDRWAFNHKLDIINLVSKKVRCIIIGGDV